MVAIFFLLGFMVQIFVRKSPIRWIIKGDVTYQLDDINIYIYESLPRFILNTIPTNRGLVGAWQIFGTIQWECLI